ncbi:unnamed protein product [Brachionus calyciflorus]|uniref:F-box domain-containing protein n=1 Tax=Brachionus calyciflorus TaxID=104777 RepID=A0A813ML43_9BILA|nr:unnamed protein product [Brachionus calyciflorus]
MFEQNYFECKMKHSLQHHRNSFDAGYESLLSQTSFLSNQSQRDTSSLFSAPSTPNKTTNSFIINCNNSTTTPDFKQQYVADVNSIYYASIRLNNEPFLSPIKNPNLIQSPLKSPKFDQFIQQRDNFASKLLRSPAFKPNNIISPTHEDNSGFLKPEIRSFNARFQSTYPSLSASFNSPDRFVRPSPTEEEFMELLIRNKHLPKNPENLIGRNMGLDYFDILTELSNKTMFNITDKILSYLDTSDLVRVASVSRDWRNLIKQNKFMNKNRVDYLKNKKYLFEKFKENRPYSSFTNEKIDKQRLSLEQRRQLLKDYRHHNSIELLKNESSVNLAKNSRGDFVFASLDRNCLNNIHHGSSRYEDFNFNRKKSRDLSSEEDEEMMIESPKKKSKSSDDDDHINNELYQACNSLFNCINKNQQIVPQRPSLLESEFKEITISDAKKRGLLHKANSVVMESSPMLRRSPIKRQMTLETSRSSTTSQNLICSKKSKKNLKRL